MEGDGYSSEQWDLIKAKISRILVGYPPYPGTKTWYVDQVAGSDTTGDGSEENPYQTVTYTLTQASARDTIIAWGTFTEDSIAPAIGQRLIGLGNGLTVLNKTTNTNPGIIVGNAGIEVTGFIVDGSLFTGHGIRIIDSNDCHIHHNTIRNITGAYDGIDKSSGAVITGANIHDNEIIDGATAGIGLVSVTESKLERNICLRNATEGIILNASCDNNVLRENICNENDEGIELQGDNNELVDNTMLNNTTANYVDSGTNNTRSDLQKKPEWGPLYQGSGTPVGLGVQLTLVTLALTYPCQVAIDLGIMPYVAGDNAIIIIRKTVGVTEITVGYIEIVNGNVINVVGTPYFQDPIAPLPAATIQALQFIYCTDSIGGFAVYVTQSAGVLRNIDYQYSILGEI